MLATSKKYDLKIQFKQGVTANGHIAPGTLSAEILVAQTHQVVNRIINQPATADDAFPLKPLTDQPFTATTSQKFNTVVYNIDNFARGTNQNRVRIHSGRPNPGGSKTVSLNSESCLVVNKAVLLTLQDDFRYYLTNEYPHHTGQFTNEEVANWINANVACTMTVKNPLSQPTIKINHAGARGFDFSISRPIEKEVKILYTETNKAGKVSTGQAFIEPYQKQTSIVQAAGSQNEQIKFNYLVKGYSGGMVDWYFDGRIGESEDTKPENLMFGDPKTLIIEGTQSRDEQAATIAMSSDGLPEQKESIACFERGARLRVANNGNCRDVAVESLQVGDSLVTAYGAVRPIRWIGHRVINCLKAPNPTEVLPIRVAAHAFGPNRPARDLLVSPGHALCVDVGGEVLIPASALVNGTTIVQLDVETVTYWHVELDSHDILLAENLPAESYLEMGNRSFFAESEAVALHARPDAPIATHADFCRPYVDCGPQVEVVRAMLRERQARAGTLREAFAA